MCELLSTNSNDVQEARERLQNRIDALHEAAEQASAAGDFASLRMMYDAYQGLIQDLPDATRGTELQGFRIYSAELARSIAQAGLPARDLVLETIGPKLFEISNDKSAIAALLGWLDQLERETDALPDRWGSKNRRFYFEETAHARALTFELVIHIVALCIKYDLPVLATRLINGPYQQRHVDLQGITLLRPHPYRMFDDVDSMTTCLSGIWLLERAFDSELKDLLMETDLLVSFNYALRVYRRDPTTLYDPVVTVPYWPAWRPVFDRTMRIPQLRVVNRLMEEEVFARWQGVHGARDQQELMQAVDSARQSTLASWGREHQGRFNFLWQDRHLLGF